MASGHLSNNVSQGTASNGVVSVSSTPTGGTMILPANPNRLHVFLTNTGSTTVTISLSNSAVSGQGIILASGQSINFQTYTGQINAITASGSTTVAYSQI